MKEDFIKHNRSSDEGEFDDDGGDEDLDYFENHNDKRTLCGSKWESITANNGLNNAFTAGRLGTSTARLGCCPADTYMSSPEGTGIFVETVGASAMNCARMRPVSEHGTVV